LRKAFSFRQLEGSEQKKKVRLYTNTSHGPSARVGLRLKFSLRTYCYDPTTHNTCLRTLAMDHDGTGPGMI
jgi:hypothetical protein